MTNVMSCQPGDQVLFKCGDTWRAEMLCVTASGAESSPITYGSYPATDCADKPRLDDTQPVTGWTVYAGNIYVADLNAGANLANFRSADGSYGAVGTRVVTLVDPQQVYLLLVMR